MSLWLIISTLATILGVILGIARWIAAVRKARADRELGQAETENKALEKTVEAAKERIATDAEVVRLPDAAADAELRKWMRDLPPNRH
jgi:hypothetical protein